MPHAAIRWSALSLLACGWLPGFDADSLLAKAAQIPAGVQVAVCVQRCRDGQVLAVVQAHTPQRLASLAKLFVSAAALTELGAEWTFKTRLAALGTVADGVLPGLAVIGGGSPCLDGDDPDGIFRDWARQLQAKGIRRIGELVIDGHLFSGPIRPATYPGGAHNVQQWFSAPASALAWNDNCIEVRVVPGQPGGPATVEVRPRSPLIRVLNRTTTVAKGDSKLNVHRSSDSNTVVVTGSYAKTTAWMALAIHERPEELIADHLQSIFAETGLPIAGAVRLATVTPAPGEVLLERADLLLPALIRLNQRSQNFYGEQILRILGQQRHGEGSITAGVRAVREILSARLGMADDAVELLDGCGLSYENRASAGTVCALLTALHRHAQGAAFHQTLLPLSAHHSLARHRRPGVEVRIKTGTINPAANLAGYLDDRVDGRLAFALLVHGQPDRLPAQRVALLQALLAAAAPGAESPVNPSPPPEGDDDRRSE